MAATPYVHTCTYMNTNAYTLHIWWITQGIIKIMIILWFCREELKLREFFFKKIFCSWILSHYSTQIINKINKILPNQTLLKMCGSRISYTLQTEVKKIVWHCSVNLNIPIPWEPSGQQLQSMVYESGKHGPWIIFKNDGNSCSLNQE